MGANPSNTKEAVGKNLGFQEVGAWPYKHLLDEWETLCARYLPVTKSTSIWRFSRHAADGDPEQGWKLHVAATVLSASRVLSKVGPLLAGVGVLFKAPNSLKELSNLNSGIHYGFSQVGKFITVYPRSTEEAVYLARELHRLTHRLPAPKVPFDLQFRPGSCVHYRYGAFNSLVVERPDGSQSLAIRDQEGRLIPDLRAPGAAVPSWIEDPFPKTSWRPARADSLKSPLRTTFLSYEALSQRGRGGVYKALDLSTLPPRQCVLKEGRRHGETAWDGRDGHCRVRHEAQVLSALSLRGICTPAVYATFEVAKHFYLVTEFIEGDNLQTVLTRGRRRLSATQALRYGLQIADLLYRMHAAGWVWRDCKPLNLMLSKGGVLRPLDFEGACAVEMPDSLPWGTPGYAPAEWKEEARSGSRVPEDLYALGATLHQLLSGQTPSAAGIPAPIGTLRRGVPPAIRAIIAALLDPDPRSRPGADTVSEVIKKHCPAG